jgi:hypothetical protein
LSSMRRRGDNRLAAMVGGEYARDDSRWDVGGEERERGR